MKVYLLLEYITGTGDVQHEFINVTSRTEQEKQTLINNFIADLCDDGHQGFKGKDYTVDFSTFEIADTVTINGNLHVSLIYGVGTR